MATGFITAPIKRKVQTFGKRALQKGASKLYQGVGGQISTPAKNALTRAGTNVAEESPEAIKQIVDTDYASQVTSKRNTSLQKIISKSPEVENNFSISEDLLADELKGNRINLDPERKQALRIREQNKVLLKKKKLTDKQGSKLSTIGALEGQEQTFDFPNPRAKAESEVGVRAMGGEKFTITKPKNPNRPDIVEVEPEIEGMPFKDLHHIFGKNHAAKIINNMWDLIEAVPPKATVDDLLNLNHLAKEYGMGLGDYGAEAFNRVPHNRTHAMMRKLGVELTGGEVKEIPFFDNADDLTQYFKETIEQRVIPMRAELDLQQRIYNELPDDVRITVENLKNAKDGASRELTRNYKAQHGGETMPDTPEAIKRQYKTADWIQNELGVTNNYLIDAATKLDQARKIQDDQMAEVVEELKVILPKILDDIERKALRTSRPGKASARTQELNQWALIKAQLEDIDLDNFSDYNDLEQLLGIDFGKPKLKGKALKESGAIKYLTHNISQQ